MQNLSMVVFDTCWLCGGEEVGTERIAVVARLGCQAVRKQVSLCQSHMVILRAHSIDILDCRGPDHTSYLSHSSHVRHVEKNLSCGEISDFYTWQMGRNLKNVAEFQISSHDRCGEL